MKRKIIITPAVVALLAVAFTAVVSAHGGNTSLIHACVSNITGMPRIVGVNDSCGVGQTALDWIKNVFAGTGLTAVSDSTGVTLSLSDGGVTTVKIADDAVTAAKVNSGSAANGQILTANGSGGASWENAAGGSLEGFQDRHLKNLTNNTDNNLFSFPLADGEGTTMNLDFTEFVKKDSDWATQAGGAIGLEFYNDGGTLHFHHSVILADYQGTVNPNNFTISASLSSGVVTVKFNPGNVIASPDVFELHYTIVTPKGETITHL